MINKRISALWDSRVSASKFDFTSMAQWWEERLKATNLRGIIVCLEECSCDPDDKVQSMIDFYF